MIDYVEYEGGQYSRYVLERTDVDQLRKMVRFFKVQRGSLISGLAIAGMKRNECVDFLLEVENVPVEDRAWITPETKEEETMRIVGALPPKEVEPIAATMNKADALLKAMCEALAGQIEAGKIDQEQVAGWVATEVAKAASESEERLAELIKSQARHLELVKIETGETLNVGMAHERFEGLLKRCRIALANASENAKRKQYLNIWLVGPAGSGKTTAAEKCAEAIEFELGEKFGFEFNGALDSEHKLLGFVDANGKIVSRPFRTAWTQGGIYLFDEVDASMPGACLALNAALANGYCDFPDQKIERHPKTVVIASGNVWNGATEDYVGRFKPDAAFADRFIKYRWDYDEKLERVLSCNDEWVDYVQKVRKAIKVIGIKQHVVSPRASFNGAMMLAGDIPLNEVIEDCVRKGLPDATWKLITDWMENN